MPLKYYGANATLSTINTTSFSPSPIIKTEYKANKTMTENKKMPINAQSSPEVEKKSNLSATKNNSNKVPTSKLAILAIALTIGLGGFVFYHGHLQVENQKKTIASLQVELANLKQSTKDSIVHDLQNSITDAVNKQNQQFSSLEQRVDRQLNEQQKNQQQLTNQINDASKLTEQNLHNLNERLSAMSTTDNSVWLISQANYLVHLAGRKIWNDQDYTTARLLLKSADESLAQADDPSLIPARQAINQDITSLSKVSFVDYDGIVMNLIGLSESLTELPLVGNYKEIDLGMTQYNDDISSAQSVNTPTNSKEVTEEPTEKNNHREITSSVFDWSNNLLTNAQSFLDKFITIEKIDENEKNFATCLSKAQKDEKQIVRCQILKTPLNLEQSLYLRENIRFRLLIAAQAVPRHQDLVYQRALSDAALWVNAYFDGNAPDVKAFLDDLENLQSQSISNQSVPDKLASATELEKLMQSRVRSMMAK
ncbi:uroporphyrinogen-III C-methyltransferase [Gilliamella sp. B3464]|uniref:uroporphyrinogen-III C-methyltransferase n=1 Tax=unclassified Gilliamella TaxID=2685620 RepID=UPI00226A913C|nr:MULTISPECIES: uroporphyrinogen-III C-methyltransferase [unclassified Gilliamella]MCX8711609.1 uroporphyrinogen-III C-methyltransferase [Gilliamella sp. B3468]MCX8750490.1 uroporphyrinogen-III C-methyltransferase [Gilliamella sp. B3464]